MSAPHNRNISLTDIADQLEELVKVTGGVIDGLVTGTGGVNVARGDNPQLSV